MERDEEYINGNGCNSTMVLRELNMTLYPFNTLEWQKKWNSVEILNNSLRNDTVVVVGMRVVESIALDGGYTNWLVVY